MIQKSLESINQRYLWFKDRRSRVILSLSEKIRDYTKVFLKKKDILEITPPVIAPATDPGLRGAKKFVIDYYGNQFKLTSSMILHKIAASSFLESDVFSYSPCVREESIKSKNTKRHLSEFWQIDVELFQKRRDEAMQLCEELLHAIIVDIKEVASSELEFLKRYLIVPKIPFPRIKYTELYDEAQSLGYNLTFGDEIPWDVERQFSEIMESPFFIIDYPVGSRGFYDRISTQYPDKLLSFDLIYPDGFGEAVSGSEREYNPDLVYKKLELVGEDPQDYQWFIDMLRKKLCCTSGFGFGFERLIRFISGISEIKEVTPFPRVPGEMCV